MNMYNFILIPPYRETAGIRYPIMKEKENRK